MKHLFTIFSLLACSLVSCTGCAEKEVVAPPCVGDSCVKPTTFVDAGTTAADTATKSVVDAGSTDSEPLYNQVYSGDGWELVAPPDWKKTSANQEIDPEILLVNAEKRNVILVLAEETPLKINDYAANAVKELKSTGAKLNSNKQIKLNGYAFVALDTSREDMRMFFWITVRNGVGYTLSCGGQGNESWQQDICYSIAAAFRIQ